MGDLADATYQRAVEVLRRNETKKGLKASHAYYNQVWARDAFISFLGANLLRDQSLLQSARATVDTFAKTRAPLGQIANFYDLGSERPEFGFSGSTDSSCWYIVGLTSLFAATADRSLLGPPLDAALDAYRFVRYQDANNSWLVDSPQGADWMDAAIQRTGKTLYNNVLLVAATKCLESLLASAGREGKGAMLLDYGALKQRVTDVFLPSRDSAGRISAYCPRLADYLRRPGGVETSAEFYLHYISFARIDARLDALSNLLCSLFGVATEEAAGSILDSIMRRGMASPYPVRVLDPPYRRGEPGYDDRFDETLPPQHRSGPFEYHNGGIWPFVGGFYVCALGRSRRGDAARQLERLASANCVLREGETVGFNEWLDGESGEAKGQYGQSWNAGMFLAAHASLKGTDPFAFLR